MVEIEGENEMTITVKYSNDLEQYKRFVRKSLVATGRYDYCIQSVDKRYDAEQGYCDSEDLTEEVRNSADSYTGSAYACEWPLKEGE